MNLPYSKEKLNRFGFIAYSYAIGAILVVFGHSYPTTTSNLPYIVDEIRTYIYSIHMPLFFAIAGFLLKNKEIKVNLNKNNYEKVENKKFILSKAKRLLTPYIVLTIIGFIPKILMSQYVNDDVSFSINYMIRIIFYPRENVWGHFWFIPTLFILYLFSNVMLASDKSKIKSIFMTIFFTYLCIYPIDTDWFAIHDICMNAIFFWVGIKSYRYICNEVSETNIIKIIILSSISIFVYRLGIYNSYIISQFTKLISALCMLQAITLLAEKLSNIGIKALDKIEKNVFTIYLLSWPAQAVGEILLNRIFKCDWYITMVSLFIIGIITPLIIVSIYNKFNLKNKLFDLVLGIQ